MGVVPRWVTPGAVLPSYVFFSVHFPDSIHFSALYATPKKLPSLPTYLHPYLSPYLPPSLPTTLPPYHTSTTSIPTTFPTSLLVSLPPYLLLYIPAFLPTYLVLPYHPASLLTYILPNHLSTHPTTFSTLSPSKI